LRIGDLIRERGPLTVAAFMDLALYHPELGYYARRPQRSGRAGDFFTSVDVGPLFGELLEVQIAEMAALLQHDAVTPADQGQRVSHPGGPSPATAAFDLVEAGAGNGRLSADILRAARMRDPELYARARLHLVEASASARAAQRTTLADLADRLVASGGALPASFEGVLLANELLDAMPVHQVVMGPDGLREVYVDVDGGGRLVAVEGAPSSVELSAYLARAGVALEPGWRVEINLNAVAWVRTAARQLRRGFLVLIDYGHAAPELYSQAHSTGTLTSFSGHRVVEAGAPATAPWLADPGEQDITTHVDFTSVQAAAEAEGCTTIAFLDQTYLLLGLVTALEAGRQSSAVRQLKSLVMPGGLGSTHKVLILGKGVGAPALRGTSFAVRVT
jgi:SAM-dependent MidA family methyltransferase